MTPKNKIEIHRLADRGDIRGFSYAIPVAALEFLEGVADVHIASIQPGAVRGNHFHRRRREIIVLTYQSAWSFHWDEGPDTGTSHQTFQGSGAVLITILPGASHAVRNDGGEALTLFAASSQPYDPEDSVARNVL